MLPTRHFSDRQIIDTDIGSGSGFERCQPQVLTIDNCSQFQSKLSKRRRSISKRALPAAFHLDNSPMASYNDSFVLNETPECDRIHCEQIPNKKSYHRDVHRVIKDDVIEECNDVHRWNMDKIWTNYKFMRSKSETRVDNNNLIFGAEKVLQLPKKYSEMDKIVLSKTINRRRNAVHIYDSEKLKENLKLFITMKHTLNYEIVGVS